MTHQVSSAMFRAIAGLCRTMVVANTGGSFALLIIFMLGGFIMPRTQIKPWWIWGYWSSPLTYAQTSITVNEFLAPRWMKVGSTKANAKKKKNQYQKINLHQLVVIGIDITKKKILYKSTSAKKISNFSTEFFF
jgi:hypothetical protein